MTDKPIIFSGPMVRALIEGRKTQDRRVLNPQPKDQGAVLYSADNCPQFCKDGFATFSRRNAPPQYVKLPYAPGDRLYVREAFNAFQFSQDGDVAWPVKIPTLEESKEANELGCRYGAPQIVYRESNRAREWFADQKWLSPIHMPRWASRLTLTVTDVRVQRLNELTNFDAIAEGIERLEGSKGPNHFTREITGKWSGSFNAPTAQEVFADLWDSLHGPDAWDANPWVAALTFTVERRNMDDRGQE